MIDKSSLSLKAALSQIKDGSTIMIGSELDPEHIITPGIFVQHVVQVQPAQ